MNLPSSAASDETHAGDGGRTSLWSASEIFVSTERQTRTDVLIFEELALHLVRHAPVEERRRSARLLARHPNAPAAVLRAYLNDEFAVAEVVISDAPISDVDLLATIATGTPGHRLAIARRADLSPAVTEAIVRVAEPEVVWVLADNTSTVFEPAVEAALARRGRTDPELARRLGRRPNIRDDSLIELFLALDAKARRRALQALELRALKHLVKNRLLVTPGPISPAAATRLSEAAASGDPERYGALVSEIASVPAAIGRALVEDAGGEALALALRSAGVATDLIIRLLMTNAPGEPRDYHELKRLADVLDQVTPRAAMLLADQWRSGQASGRTVHVPPTIEPRDHHREVAQRPSEARATARVEAERQSG